MIHLFVIADDFTGALDTGVQFASYGAATKVVVGTGLQALEADAQTQVLVVDAETRHLPAAQAYDTVYRLVRWAKEKKIGCIYKKTDSALRGNIGAELSAALAADGGDRLHFVPAFPNLERVTRGGVHYIGGVPVAQSVFGKDPFEPVTHSRVEDILHEQTDTLCAYIPGGGSAEGKAGVLVYEAQTNRDMAQIADRLAARSETGLLAGCAGFASVLPRLLQLSCRDTAPLPLCGRLLAVCGSINPVSLEQCAQAEAQGAPRFSLTPEQNEKVLADTGICFLFAQGYHKSMKNVAPVRKGMGERTIFNVLGPLSNPARATMQLLGVYDENLVMPMAQVLSNLGVTRGMVVCGGGMDEASLIGDNKVCEIRDGRLTPYQLDPEKYGLSLCTVDDLRGGSPRVNAQITRDILSGREQGAKREEILLNAGIALYLGLDGLTLEDGIKKAAELIDSGAALAKLDQFAAATQEAAKA